MRYFSRVIVGLSRAPVDADVLRYARLIRETGGRNVQFLFAHVPVASDGSARALSPAIDAVRRELLVAVNEHFGDVATGDIQVLCGSHIDKLLEAAADLNSDLILIGHRRSARGRRSSSRRLAMKAPCSVWMVPEGSPPRISGVLAAADFSQPSAYAVSLASLIAQRAGLETCAVLHVMPPQRRFDTAEQKRTARAFDRFLAPLDLHGIAVRQVMQEGGSVAGVAASSGVGDGVDLVVLGTRGCSPSAAVLLGSESEGVLLESQVPVLVTKDRGERLGILSALLDREFPHAEVQFG